jgi:hypothetical protein
MRGALLCVVAGLAACTPAEPEVMPAAAVAPEVAPQVAAPVTPVAVPAAAPAADLARFGELRIGAPFGKAPGDEAFVSAGMRELMEGDCEYYDKGTLPEGMSMMVLGDHIARFEVDVMDDPSIRVDAPAADAPALPFGLWVGMSVTEAKTRLPEGVVTSPHAYASPDGEYLTWTDKANKLALRLETLNGLVTSIYWGQPEAVELIEGCA